MQEKIAEKTYAGVLGKIIGVFYGRPIEGWPYEKIRKTFDVVDHYVYKEAGTPLIVADDDVAGTFTFLNAVEDTDHIRELTAEDFGEAWLDYVIEDKTIFWWGGLGRSTEHTAYLRLKQGVKAPESGSAALNGEAVAEQIGAQIFMDALAMMCPGDPQMARKLVRESARVSHDGIAVEAACFLASLEALAYEIRDIEELLNQAEAQGVSDRLGKIIEDVRQECRKTDDFRQVRDWLETYYGYQLYPGNCHVIPNFALILASLILGGDDFGKAMRICISCGWDTDCNGANLGCINGIRLGLSAINENFDFRGPIADRLYNISANGGECVSDAVQQTRRILAANARLYGRPVPGKKPRYAFEYPGAVQGFASCPYLERESYPAENASQYGKGNGLLLRTRNGRCAVSVPVMFDPADRQQNYCLTASPVLYEGQTVHAEFKVPDTDTQLQLYAAYYNFDNQIQICYGPVWKEGQKHAVLTWKLPSLGGMPVARMGVLCMAGVGKETEAILKSMDWNGAPEHFEIRGSLRNYDIGLNMAMESFVSSARQFHFDSRASFTISHTERNGAATIGTAQWKDYMVSSRMEPSLHKRFGVIGRARGHRRYYALMLWDGRYAGIFCRKGGKEYCLAKVDFSYGNNEKYDIELCMNKDRITGRVRAAGSRRSNEEWKCLKACDGTYRSGGAGFVVDEGTVLAYDFCVEGLNNCREDG